MRTFLFALACIVVVTITTVLPISTAQAAVRLPSYAQGADVTTDVQNKGKKVTDLISMIVAILAIIGMLIGAGYYGVGNGEKGKTFLIGGVVALVIAGSVYGIAAMVI